MQRNSLQAVPLGDQGVLIYFPDERSALDFAQSVRVLQVAWIVDVVSSYRSVAVFFDLDQIRFDEVVVHLSAVVSTPETVENNVPGRLHRIPCCYDFAPDLDRVRRYTRLSAERIVELHTATVYTVYAIGFSPGFPYLGYLPAELSGVPRLGTPRLKVEAGCVGLTGRQTGIYTQARPGGWNLIGRVPLELVDVRDSYFPLRTGDSVQFEAIDTAAFAALAGKRL